MEAYFVGSPDVLLTSIGLLETCWLHLKRWVWGWVKLDGKNMGVVVACYGEANRWVFNFPMHIRWEMSHTGSLGVWVLHTISYGSSIGSPYQNFGCLINSE